MKKHKLEWESRGNRLELLPLASCAEGSQEILLVTRMRYPSTPCYEYRCALGLVWFPNLEIGRVGSNRFGVWFSNKKSLIIELSFSF